MCVYVCVCVCTSVNACVRMCRQVYACVGVYLRVYSCVCVCMRVYACIRVKRIQKNTKRIQKEYKMKWPESRCRAIGTGIYRCMRVYVYNACVLYSDRV